MSAYKAAVKALDGPDCTVALGMAREARSKLGDSAEVSCNYYCEPGRETLRALLECCTTSGGECPRYRQMSTKMMQDEQCYRNTTGRHLTVLDKSFHIHGVRWAVTKKRTGSVIVRP